MYTCTQIDEDRKVKSLCVLTVHDSIVVDVHPDEKDIVKEILIDAMENVAKEVKVRFNYEMVIPLAIEIKSGSNWLNGNVIYG
jgi:DNA polymerase I-like protein with 3'-5' exonuclease and polymerase domains